MLTEVWKSLGFGSRGKKALPNKFKTAYLPLSGFEENRYDTRFVDGLSDADLEELNAMLDWQCFTVDKHGRRFGNAAWHGKRTHPQVIPDPRIELMHRHFDLSAKHVLEVGCFEGVHTTGLCQFAQHVTAVDSRMANVVKTIVRTAMFGYSPTVFKCDVEDPAVDMSLLSADVAHHVGVLYHLKDPVGHLRRLGTVLTTGLMLDTHYTLPTETNGVYQVDGEDIPYKWFAESGHADAFSGMYDHAKWLTLETIKTTLKTSGFHQVQVLEERQERNGPRVLLMANR